MELLLRLEEVNEAAVYKNNITTVGTMYAMFPTLKAFQAVVSRHEVTTIINCKEAKMVELKAASRKADREAAVAAKRAVGVVLITEHEQEDEDGDTDEYDDDTKNAASALLSLFNSTNSSLRSSLILLATIYMPSLYNSSDT